MMILRKVKENLFLLMVVMAYLLMFLLKADAGITAVQNSAYYIKEMLTIMPVVFVLTALLDTWVSKEKIMKYLGKESKAKGVVLSFVLGSISAGPIYAAFPMCIMLHKKGASIRNLIIILSSWAVIKVPMLLNEVKFLGPKFMAVRWLLTVIAILLFSYFISKIMVDEDIPHKEESADNLTLDRDACMGCALCTKTCPELFVMQGKKAFIKSAEIEVDQEKLKKALEGCPVHAIHYKDV